MILNCPLNNFFWMTPYLYSKSISSAANDFFTITCFDISSPSSLGRSIDQSVNQSIDDRVDDGFPTADDRHFRDGEIFASFDEYSQENRLLQLHRHHRQRPC